MWQPSAQFGGKPLHVPCQVTSVHCLCAVKVSPGLAPAPELFWGLREAVACTPSAATRSGSVREPRLGRTRVAGKGVQCSVCGTESSKSRGWGGDGIAGPEIGPLGVQSSSLGTAFRCSEWLKEPALAMACVGGPPFLALQAPAICTIAAPVQHPIATLRMGGQVHKAPSTLWCHVWPPISWDSANIR